MCIRDSDFDKAAVLALLTQNAHRAAEQTTAIPKYPHTQKGRLQEEKAAKTTPVSYTHLDVYKRQIQYYQFFKINAL